jgi:hypothetical protein
MAKVPKNLTELHIRKAVDYVERETAALVDLYFEQANVFSAIVGIFGVKALHAVSPYKKHKHPDVAQQRFPDLSLGGKLNPPATQPLESCVKSPAEKLKDAAASVNPNVTSRNGKPVMTATVDFESAPPNKI